jgi:NDP-sugar pyrophosphorylase family protein
MMKAMILAAGYGERLWPLTADRTKPALPVLGKPLVGYVAEYLAKYGIEDVVVNLHHQPDSVRGALGDGSQFGVHLHYVLEPVILGTSGAMDNARELLEGDTFIVVNGKLITDLDLWAALETHRREKALATLILLRNPTHERFSVVEARDGLVTKFAGMPGPPEVYPRAIAAGERIAAHVTEGMWYELSTLKRYLDISLALLRQRGQDAYAGRNPSIDQHAEVRESVLWNDVSVEKGAYVRRAILGDGVRVPAGERLEDVAVVRAEIIAGTAPPSKALKGHIAGPNFVVPLSQ